MNNIWAGWLVTAALLASPAITIGQAKADAAPAGGKTLKVKLNYTGSGTVDERHKIYAMVTDSDPFAAEVLAEAESKPAAGEATKPGQPKTAYVLARQGTAEKNGVVTFTGLSVTPVYVVAFFDKPGAYETTHGPGSGSPMGMYSVAPGKPEAVKLKDGKTVDVKVTFDDTTKTP